MRARRSDGISTRDLLSKRRTDAVKNLQKAKAFVCVLIDYKGDLRMHSHTTKAGDTEDIRHGALQKIEQVVGNGTLKVLAERERQQKEGEQSKLVEIAKQKRSEELK